MEGQIFGRLTVLKQDGKLGRNIAFLCRCKCGTERRFRGSHLRLGTSTSCGCQRGDSLRRHGMTGTRLYSIWHNMLQRCNNPNNIEYANYGGRGISVDERWKLFDNFLADVQATYQDDLTLDRPEVDGNYGPENFRWATALEQGSNKRNNVMLTLDGITKTSAEWSRETGIPARTIRKRKSYGWSDERILTTPGRGEMQ